MSTTILHSSPMIIPSGGSMLAGRVYRQTDDPTVRQPAVIVTGSWLTVKEQMAQLYAEALAARGYTAVTFDFSGFGESPGDPHHAELPGRKIADIDAVARHVSTLSYVSPGRVSHLGVCASAQYALAAAAGGAPFDALISVAGWFHDTASVAPFYGGVDGVRLRLKRAQHALETYRSTGEVVTVPAYSPGDDRAGMMLPLDYYADPERGAVSEWTNEMAELSWQPWLTFDGLARARNVTTPTLFVHSDGCVFPDNVRRLSDAIAGPVELVWADGEQTDFYDRPHQVGVALEAVDAFLSATV